MRLSSFCRAGGPLLAASLALTCLTGEADAQSLFDALFGSSTPKPSIAYPGHSQRLLPPGGMVMPYSPRNLPSRRGDDDDGHKPADGKGGGHHTVCVRMCDGYYWPVSYSAPRSRFYRDANACTASCGSEARLFHYPTTSTDMKEAVDLSGRAYVSLPTAFKYRKALVAGCTCKPEPWSEAEMDRHRIYAMNEEMAKGQQPPSSSRNATVPPPPASRVVASASASDATEFTDEEKVKPAAKSPLAAIDRPDETAPAPRKAERPRPAEQPVVKPRSRAPAPAQPQAQPVRVTAKPPAGQGFAGGGLWGGQSQYTWPGDAPRRIR